MHFFMIMYIDFLGIVIGTDNNGLNECDGSRNGETWEIGEIFTRQN